VTDDDAAWAKRQVAQAPKLSEDQRAKLAELLRPVRKQILSERAGGAA
jgi:hypothetical protein